MMYKLTFIPTLRNNLAIKSCVYSVPNPLEWMLESIEEL
jgi:hypothetical protein